jgi:hypothetical protein
VKVPAKKIGEERGGRQGRNLECFEVTTFGKVDVPLAA